MSRYELRDISDRLARSADSEAVAYEFLGALQKAYPTWRATLAFYEISRDALVKLYEREKDQLRHRDIKVMVDQLPPRMIRNFFHPNAAIEPHGRHAPPGAPIQAAPLFEPDLNDAVLLRALLPVATWQSAVCLPLTDRGEMLAILTVVSSKSGAFGPKILDEITPIKSMAAFALAQRLHLATHAAKEPDPDAARRAAAEFQERVEQLSIHARELEEDSEAKTVELRRLTDRIGVADRHPDARDEIERVKQALKDMEARSTRATEGLSQASAQLEMARGQVGDLRRTQDFLRQVFESLAAEHDPRQHPGKVVRWVSEHFGIDRCSVMLIDRSGYLMRIAEQQGIPPEVAERARVRLGQGVAGWVAQNRKPLFVRHIAETPSEIERNVGETYSTNSFICVPIIFNGRCTGVLNLSNKKDGAEFDDADLERATLAAGVFAITLGANEVVRRALAWAA